MKRLIKRQSPSNPDKQLVDSSEEVGLELALRPAAWDEYVGQESAKANLRLIIDAARERGESCDHILLYGQPGLGKTTLAFLIGKEMGAHVRTTSGPSLEKVGDIAAILTNLEPNEILFIDEAHRVNKAVEEILYPAMESRKLHIIVGKGASARTFSLDLPSFTIIAATTKINLLTAPLRARFGATFRLDYYTVEDIQKIVARSSQILGCSLVPQAAVALATASRFTPRVVNRLLKRARDYAQIKRKGEIDEDVVKETLKLLDVDSLGLEKTDRELLYTLISKFNGGPVGVRALGAALGEEVGTIEDVYEPFLMKLGLLHRTPLGRVATRQAYQHLKVPPNPTLV